MKIYKKLIGLMLITIIILNLCSCGNSKENEIIKKFITRYYTIEDYTSMDVNTVRTEYPNDKYTQSFKDIMTPELFKNFTLDSRHESYISHAVYRKLNIKVKDIKLDKYTEGSDGTVTYNYEGTLEINKTLKNEIMEEDISGQVTVVKSDKTWLIYQPNKMNTDEITSIIKSIN